jgi:hypothetical protein
MNYALIYYLTLEEFATRDDPEKGKAFWASFLPYLQAIKDSGIFVSGAGLQAPATATTLRFGQGQRLVQDGPVAETKEQLGGLIVIDVPNLDTAMEWAGRYPGGPGGAVEVRPSLAPMKE